MTTSPPDPTHRVPTEVLIPPPPAWTTPQVGSPPAGSRASTPPVPPPPVESVTRTGPLGDVSPGYSPAPSPAPCAHDSSIRNTTRDLGSTADRVRRMVVQFVLLLDVFAAAGGAVLALAGAITHRAAAGGWLLWAALPAAAVTAYRTAITRPTVRPAARGRS